MVPEKKGDKSPDKSPKKGAAAAGKGGKKSRDASPAKQQQPEKPPVELGGPAAEEEEQEKKAPSPLDQAVAVTQAQLGALITAPALKPALLRRPPFQFLHAIVTSIIFYTGFAKEGVFAEGETHSESIKDKAS